MRLKPYYIELLKIRPPSQLYSIARYFEFLAERLEKLLSAEA